MPKTHESLPVWNELPPHWNPADERAKPWLDLFLLPGQTDRAMVLVFPGGGYNMLADHEGDPVAETFNRLGFHAAVLHYRTQCHSAPRPLGKGPLSDAQRAVRILRANAAKWKINPSQIAVLGFSAGGHLAGTVGVHNDAGDAAAADVVERQSSRPDAVVSCYGALCCLHATLVANLCGEGNDELAKYLSVDKQVAPSTPPMFLWHTADDATVPVAYSLNTASALAAAKVPFELHVFPHGRHGVGLGQGMAGIEKWPELCGVWFRGVFGGRTAGS